MKLEYCPVCKRDMEADEPLFDLDKDNHVERCRIVSKVKVLRSLCDAHGPVKAARLIGWHYSTIWRKLNGKSRITARDERLIEYALERADDVLE